jgi:general secretion pathway protein D
MVIQIIPLNYISSEEMAKLLAPFVSGGGAIVSHKQPNTLVVADKDSNIRKILRLIQAFDVNFFEKSGYRFYLLEHADAEDMAKLCTDVFGTGDANKDQVKFIAISRLNTVLAVSANPGIFSKIEEVIRQADVAGDKAEPKIHVYSVKNGEAGEIAELLNSVFSETPSEKKESDKTIKETEKKEVKKDESAMKSLFPGSTTTSSSAKKTGTTKKSDKKSGTGTSGTMILRNGMRVTPDTVRNALIIEAAPKDYHMIADILEKIDMLPRQVLIRVMVAEITLNIENKLGVEWSYVRGSGGTPDTSVLKGAIGSPGVTDFAAFSGLKFMIGEDKRWGATLSALASDGKVNILSTPSVLASDNKEANIEISDEIPVPDTQVQYPSSYTATQSTTTSIQYRNTGVILTVTPHINEFGLVSMDVKQEVSELKDQTITIGSLEASAFFKRSVETSLTVRDGQTIVLGGLIKEKKSNTVTGIPCLTSIPVVQYLFGTKTQKSDKTELIVLITPQVITSLDDVDAVTQEFKTKVDRIRHEAE